MAPECGRCGYSSKREPGFYLGSIYINYGVTAIATILLYAFGNGPRSLPRACLGGVGVGRGLVASRVLQVGAGSAMSARDLPP